LGIKQQKLVAGDNFMRIIAPKFSKYPPNKLPFYGREVFIHSNIGSDRRTFICTRKTRLDGTNNRPCPICELADQIRALNPDDKRLEALYASCRYFFFVYNVKDQSTEAEGLHWIDAPKKIKDNIVSISRDRRTGNYVDVSDPQTGADIEFSRVGTKLSTTYEGFKLSNNGVPPEEWYANVPDDFDEFLLWPEYDRVYAEVFGGAAAPVLGSPAPGSVVDPAPAAAPTRTRQPQPAPAPVAAGVPESVTDPDPAPAAATPQPQPAPQPQPVPQPQPAPAAAPTRQRGGAAPGGAVSDEVQSRIDQLKQGQAAQ
jgi:hypothetical protein